MEISRKFQDIAEQFALEGEPVSCTPFGSGHINDTYCLTCRTAMGERRYTLQKMNREIFTSPADVMENIEGITAWLRSKILSAGGDVFRETLNIVPTRDDQSFYTSPDQEVWRVFLFIEGASSYDIVKKKEDFYQCALAFGKFSQMLADYPADTLHETIPNFHNTPDRLDKFERAAEKNSCGRAKNVSKEIAFVREHGGLAHALSDRLSDGRLPLRVTHNDTKLNNVMIDDQTGRAICVIDLDTVMPGLTAHDFGDAIRFGASTAEEDERDLDKVHFSTDLYETYVRGYMESCGKSLTGEEIDCLPAGAMVMTYECGMRFLTDYLEGDHYFKISRPGHNLDRARTQFKLVAEMEEVLPQMREIVGKYRS